jgi:hypothetical protein
MENADYLLSILKIEVKDDFMLIKITFYIFVLNAQFLKQNFLIDMLN